MAAPVTMIPSLSRCSTVPLSRLQQHQRMAMFDLLDEFSGKKVLAVDEELIAVLDIILELSELKEHGAEIRRLGKETIHTDSDQIIFLVRSTSLEVMSRIANQIQRDEKDAVSARKENAAGRDRTYVLAFCPRKCDSAIHLLKQTNTWESFHFVRELPSLAMFVCDDDLMSMELPSQFRDFHVACDASSTYEVAIAISQFEKRYLKIPKIFAFGRAAKYVADILASGSIYNRHDDAGGLNTEADGGGGSGAMDGEVGNVPESQLGVPKFASVNSATKNAASTSQRRQAAGAAISSAGDRESEIESMILIDRRVDFASVLCSQFTYEALIDQEFGISVAAKTHAPTSIVGDLSAAAAQNNGGATGSTAGKQPSKTQLLKLNNDDTLFQEIRHTHISGVGPVLHKKTVKMQQIESEKDSIQSVQDMQGFMVKLKALTQEKPSLSAHVNLAHYFNEKKATEQFQSEWKLEDSITSGTDTSGKSLSTIEEGMDAGWPLGVVLRLLCLYSTVYGGIPARILESLKRGIIQVYGYQTFNLLSNLETIGLLTTPTRIESSNLTSVLLKAGGHTTSAWTQLKKEFNLVVEDQDADISYAYSGYAPLSVRLVEKLRAGRPKGSLSDAMALVDGTVCEIDRFRRARNPTRNVLVFFVGGVTYGEIAALRRLSEIEKDHPGGRNFLIGTTSFVNYETFFGNIENKDISVNTRKARLQAHMPRGSGGGIVKELEAKTPEGVRGWFGL